MPYPKEDLFNFQRVCTKVVQPSGAKWGKTGKTAVLPGFCKMERAVIWVLSGLGARATQVAPVGR